MAAQDTSYVDDNAATNTPPCTLASPCSQINTAIGDTNANGTVIVDGGTYSEAVTLNGNKSLTAQEFAGTAEGSFVIDGAASAAITVPVSATAGTVKGFALRSTNAAVMLLGPVTLTNNDFDSTDPDSQGIIVNATAAGPSTIGPNNDFTDDGTDADRRSGIVVNAGDVQVTGNRFSALSLAISVSDDSATISGNEITGTHTAAGSLEGRAILVGGGHPTIAGNHIHSPDPNTGHIGIDISNLLPPTGATLRRNRIFGHSAGVTVFDSDESVSLNSDVIRGSADAGLRAFDTGTPDTDVGDVLALNVTLGGNATDIDLDDTALALDSSIVEDPINRSGTPSCSITFSRGPTTTGDACETFQTSADPLLAPDGYHLLPGSPMIDMGATDLPGPPDHLDVDGQPRAVGGTFTCAGQSAARLDIGADEFQPAAPSCPAALVPPLSTTNTATPPPPAKKKKCKRKKKGAAAAKKCKRKKK